MARHSLQTDDFYLSSFLSGLRADIQQALYVYKPKTLMEAMDKAKEQQLLMDLLGRIVRGNSKAYTSPVPQKWASEGTSLKNTHSASFVYPNSLSKYTT